MLIKVEEICICFKEEISGKFVSFHRHHKNQQWLEEGKRKINIKIKGISTAGKPITANLLVPDVASLVLSRIHPV